MAQALASLDPEEVDAGSQAPPVGVDAVDGHLMVARLHGGRVEHLAHHAAVQVEEADPHETLLGGREPEHRAGIQRVRIDGRRQFAAAGVHLERHPSPEPAASDQSAFDHDRHRVRSAEQAEEGAQIRLREADREVFDQCTDTIIRQVDDIKRMVDEFSKFARMPKAVIELEDIADTVRQAVFLMRVGNADIDIDLDLKEDPMPARFDRRLISQALTNIIKNATEAIEQVPPEELGKGRIDVVAQRENDDILIDVIDNGIGLPKENRSRLLEPYVTTREKGTGLGLAIVGKILEEHGGRIELHDAAEIRPGARGAWMRLRFAISGHASNAETKPNDDVTRSSDETAEPSDATNNQPKIEAATGN